MTGPEPIVVFAPARVDLSAGFTDVEPFCTELPGRVVNVALDLGVEVAVREQPARGPIVSFVDRLCAATARRLAIPRPVVHISASALPAGSGLGASGALSVALAYALSLHAGSTVEPAALVELACLAEGEAGLTGGTQDQLASVYGGAGLVCRHRDLGRRRPIDADLPALGDRLVLVHGSGSRNSGSIIEHVLNERPRAQVLRTIDAMNRNGELLASRLEDGDHEQLAYLVNESTALLRDLHDGIVGDGVDQWLRTLGAAAAKPCGAGGPGAVWAALVDPAARTAFVAGVRKAGWSTLVSAPSAVGASPRRSADASSS
jgi:galactokinase/mevalonate kinase-like predicted kinase